MTNGDCIRKWTDEEIADFTTGVVRETCEKICKGFGVEFSVPDGLYEQTMNEWLEWLKKEVEDEDGD